jgi:putative polyhydroxyalkanoate system protein
VAELKIVREHALGLEGAREVARRWREQAESEWGMQCEPPAAGDPDRLAFARTGVSGELTVTDKRFELTLQLGFLLGAYSARIEQQIRQNLDELLGPA